jgi:hypothetical protein
MDNKLSCNHELNLKTCLSAILRPHAFFYLESQWMCQGFTFCCKIKSQQGSLPLIPLEKPMDSSTKILFYCIKFFKKKFFSMIFMFHIGCY